MNHRLFNHLAIFFLLGLVAVSCKKETQEQRPSFSLAQADQISEENYAIYSLVINEKYTAQKIVIAQKTASTMIVELDTDFNDYLLTNHPGFDATLIQAHRDLNENTIMLGNQFESGSKQLLLISSSELSYIFDSQNIESDWNEFYTYYDRSNGVVNFSRIAFNQDKTQCIFEVGLSSGSLSGAGSFIYLEKQNGQWAIVEDFPTWVS